MSDLIRRMDRVAEKLDAELDSVSPIHDLTDEELEAFDASFRTGGEELMKQLCVQLDPDELRRMATERQRMNADPRELTDRELWKSLSPLVPAWRAHRAKANQSVGIDTEQESR